MSEAAAVQRSVRRRKREKNLMWARFVEVVNKAHHTKEPTHHACADCRWRVFNEVALSERLSFSCTKHTTARDVVMNGQADMPYCTVERTALGRCGIEGDFFEKRVAQER